MLFICKNLEYVLKEIAFVLESGDLIKLGDLLKERHNLMKKLNSSKPNRENAVEVADSLKTLISLEQLITTLAEQKQNKIMEDLKQIRNKKMAHDAYSHQCLKGVRP